MKRLTRETRHGYCIGTLDRVNDTVAEDVGSSEGHEEDC